MKRVLSVVGLLLSCTPLFAQVNIAWAHAAIGQNGQGISQVVGAPDGKTITTSDNAFLYAVNFNYFKSQRTAPVSYTGLGRLLGISDAEINRYDIIAFEGNGNLTPGWESSIWFVTDDMRAAAGSFAGDQKTAQGTCCVNLSTSSPLRFLSGTMPKDKFATYFHVTLPADYSEFTSWILIDVPDEIHVDADAFRLWISGAPIGKYTNPDPDAFGVIRH